MELLRRDCFHRPERWNYRRQEADTAEGFQKSQVQDSVKDMAGLTNGRSPGRFVFNRQGCRTVLPLSSQRLRWRLRLPQPKDIYFYVLR